MTRTLSIALLLFIQLLAYATVYDVNLVDLDGPQIAGQVNTATDRFVVTSWIEYPGGLVNWSPAAVSLPLTYTALTSSGAIFDVPDIWDGKIDLTWGFVADARNAGVVWNEGVFSEPGQHHGWGGGRSRATRPGIVVSVVTEMHWQWSPTGMDDVYTSTFDLVSVVAVPEPAGIATTLLGAFILSGRWRGRAVLHYRMAPPVWCM